MRLFMSTLCLVGILIAALVSVTWAEGISSVLIPNTGSSQDPSAGFEVLGQGCTLVTFEGLGNLTPIAPIAGPVTVTFGASWLSLIDADAGGTGTFANEPTPETAAFYPSTVDIAISLVPTVQFVEFFYVAGVISLPVMLTAFDARNQIVDTAVGSTIGTSFDGAPCTGDPNGNFCLWDTITLNSATGNIARIEITGSTASAIGFDNMLFCTEIEVTGACCLPSNLCSETSEVGCAAAGCHFPRPFPSILIYHSPPLL